MNTRSRSGIWLTIKMVTQSTSRVSDAEVIIGDADDTEGMVAHDTQMRDSPSFFPDSTQVCVEMDVNGPKEKGQPVMEGTQLRSARRTAIQASESDLEGREGCRSRVLE